MSSPSSLGHTTTSPRMLGTEPYCCSSQGSVIRNRFCSDVAVEVEIRMGAKASLERPSWVIYLANDTVETPSKACSELTAKKTRKRNKELTAASRPHLSSTMAGIIFATVLIRIIRAISDASTPISGTPAPELVRYQPPPQAAHKSKRDSCNENRPPRQLPRASQATQRAIEASEDQHDQ